MIQVSGATGTVTQFVDDLLTAAVRLEANDIHIERYATRARLRYRLGGVLTEVETGDYLTQRYDEVTSRLKVLASMDIAEHRLPQDGSFVFRCDYGEVDARASAVPTVGGEKIALRLFARKENSFNIEWLGLNDEQLAMARAATSGRAGMILVAGPTGSGKTTTLYAMLEQVNAVGINILTAEDPVERRLAGINQCEVRREIQLDFASLLRAFLRQDPEVIMIGEIRDAETADIAVKAALTGHLVLSTVHSGGAVETLQRMVHLGVAPQSVAAAVRLVVAQRLLRRVCEACGVPDTRWRVVEGEGKGERGSESKSEGETTLRHGAGCEACAQTGYSGRLGVFEILQAGAMKANDDEPFSFHSWRPKLTITQSGARLVREGRVSVAEFQRVFGDVPPDIVPVQR